MNSDLPTYATIAAAGLLGFGFAVLKTRKADSGIAIRYTITLLVASLASALWHASETDFVFAVVEERIIEGVVPLLFGLGLLTACIFIISGSAYWLTRYSMMAISARKSLNEK